MTRDHVIPQAVRNRTNLSRALTDCGLAAETVPACRVCNEVRGDTHFDKWLPYPLWLAVSPQKLLPKQRTALKRRGKLPSVSLGILGGYWKAKRDGRDTSG